MQQQSEFVRRNIRPYGSGFNPARGRKPKSRTEPTTPLWPKTPVRPLYTPDPPPPHYVASSHREVCVGDFIQALTGVIGTPQRGETFRRLFGGNTDI